MTPRHPTSLSSCKAMEILSRMMLRAEHLNQAKRYIKISRGNDSLSHLPFGDD